MILDIYNCTPNPFITKDYIFYDSDRKQINICNERINYEINTTICNRICPRNCHQSFYSIKFQNIIEDYSDDSSDPKDIVLKFVNKPKINKR